MPIGAFVVCVDSVTYPSTVLVRMALAEQTESAGLMYVVEISSFGVEPRHPFTIQETKNTRLQSHQRSPPLYNCRKESEENWG